MKNVFSVLSVSLLLLNHSSSDLRHFSAFALSFSSEPSPSNTDVSSANKVQIWCTWDWGMVIWIYPIVLRGCNRCPKLQGEVCVRFRWVIFKLMLVNGAWCIFCEIVLRWMYIYLIDDKSLLVQVMAWCRQAIRHYLNQFRPRSMSPYVATKPQCLKLINDIKCDPSYQLYLPT